MRSKTITDDWGDKLRVAKSHATPHRWPVIEATAFRSPGIVQSAIKIVPSTKSLREHGQACIQIADEIDAAKEASDE